MALGRASRLGHGLADTVRLHGPSDPAPLLQAADLFVPPSHYEAFGQSALEAVAAGLPVVASHTGGLPDFLLHGENALMHPPKDIARMGEALQRLLDDPDLRARLGRRGRAIATERFSFPAVARRYAALCRRLVSSTCSVGLCWQVRGLLALLA